MLRKGITIKCPECGFEEELIDLAAWSFIILRNTKCSKCNTAITHDHVKDEDAS